MMRYWRKPKRYLFGAFGNTVFHDVVLTPGVLLKEIIVYLRGNIILSAGTASGTSVGENPGGLIQAINVDATRAPNGFYPGGRIKALTPRSILRGNIFDAGRFQDDLGAVSVTGAAATFAINLRLPVRFALRSLKRNWDTALRLDQFQQVQLQIQNAGALTQMLVGNDRTVDVSGLYYDVVEYREFNPASFPISMAYETDFVKQIVAANQRLSIDDALPKGESYLDALIIAMTTNQALSDAVLNKVTSFSQLDDFEELYNIEIQGENRDFITEVASTSKVGLYYLPYADGMQSRAVPDLNLLLDVSNPGTDQLLIRTRRVIPAVLPKKAA